VIAARCRYAHAGWATGGRIDRDREPPTGVRAMNMPSRRRFLAHSLLATSAVAGASLLGTPGRLWAAAGETKASPLLTRPIPSTGELLPVIGAGTSGSYDVDPGSAEYAQLQQVVKHFFEGGGRVIDTSPNYGRSDTVLGSLLADGGWRK